MKNTLTIKKLGDIINLKRGYDLPRIEMKEGIIPVIGSNGIIGYHNEYTTKAPCLTIGRSGSVGKLFFSNVDSWAHNTSLYINDFKGNNPKYIFYLLQTIDLASLQAGSVIPSLNRNFLHPLLIKYQNQINEQQKIANILSALDDKIELNNKINAELESMAKTIYDYWFVQFDFPDENGKPYKTSGGKMVWNNEIKREIPFGWEVNNILKIADLFGGGTPKTNTSSFWNGNIPFFTPTDSSKSFFVTETIKKITNDGLNSCSTKLYSKGTIFITARGTVGNVNIASENMAMNQSCYAITSKNNGDFYYVHQCCLRLINHLKNKSNGSIFDAIIANDIKSIKLLIPKSSVIDSYNTLIKKSYAKILITLKENRKLAELRDWLLPLLMNGQISFKDQTPIHQDENQQKEMDF